MALNKLSFIRGTAGLGRPLPGKDHISGMLFYSNTLPSGFGTSDRIKKIFSLADAEGYGITDANISETVATGTVEITAIGSNGDTLEIKVLSPSGSISLGTYTKVALDTTVTLVGDAVEAVINEGTATHGFVASNAVGVVTLTAPSGTGVFYNTGTPISTVIVGTLTASIVQFSGGVASPIDTMHYHISEYFRIQPKGVLYVGIYAVPGGAYDFADVTTIRVYANGEIRQMGVYAPGATYNAALATALHTEVVKSEEADAPFSAILTPNINGTALSALPTLASNTSYRVSVDIAQDGGNKGLELYYANSKSIGCMGCLLGAVSNSSVNEDIAWVGKFNLSDGNELETVAFSNGVLFKDQSQSLLNTLNDYKYIFLRKFTNKAGSYFNDSHTAITSTNDFAYIENVRTMDKAIRDIQETSLEKLNSPLQLNANGTLQEDDIAEFERLASIALDNMQRNAEISAYTIDIDPIQPVLSTSTIEISVLIVPVGVARNIIFKVSFTTSV
jgi:hypothetical protein